MFRLRVAFLALLAALPLAGCGLASDPRPTVVVSFYPLQYVVEQLAGSRVRILDLTSPGTEPHDLELKVRQVAEMSNAALVVYEHGLQPAVDQSVAQNAQSQSLDVARFVNLDPGNPHFWLDPLRLAAAATAVEARLARIDPGHAPFYAARLVRLHRTLTALDAAYTSGLAHCARHLVVTSHDAFRYQRRYGLEFAPIAGLSPDAEPSPVHIAQLRDLIQKEHITTVFSETIASPKMADVLASDLGLRAAVLDPIEGVAAGSHADYASLMRANLAALQQANDCVVPR